MKELVVFALAFAYASASGLDDLTPVNVLDIPNVRITRGYNALPGQFPYQVRLDLQRDGKHSLCGGSLISHTWVLTAAHCTHKVDNVTVFLGSIRRSHPLVNYTIGQKDITTHEQFSFEMAMNDIALIRIPYVEYSSAIRSVKLPRIQSWYQSYAGRASVATGWGKTSDNFNTTPDILQYTILRVMANKDCRASWNISSSNICVSTPLYASTCRGDSGGPLVQYHDRVLIGLTSYGTSKCENGVPNVFTRVTSFLRWIKNHTGLPL